MSLLAFTTFIIIILETREVLYARHEQRVSPVTLMPDPGVVRGPRPEVRLAFVVDLGGEAEKAAVGAGVGVVSATGQTVFLLGALQNVHGSVLQVGGLLHHLGIKDQVWGRWGVLDKMQGAMRRLGTA